jgi:hypothetical protein
LPSCWIGYFPEPEKLYVFGDNNYILKYDHEAKEPID